MAVSFPTIQLQQRLDGLRQSIPANNVAQNGGSSSRQPQGTTRSQGQGTAQQERAGSTRSGLDDSRARQIQLQIEQLQKKLEKIQKDYVKMLQAGPQAEGELRAKRLVFMQQMMQNLEAQIARLTQQLAMLSAAGQQPPQLLNPAQNTAPSGTSSQNSLRGAGGTAATNPGFSGLSLTA